MKIEPCKIRIPVENREEISTRIQKCCFSNSIYWSDSRVTKYTNSDFLFIELGGRFGDLLNGYGEEIEYFESDALPEISAADFIEKYGQDNDIKEGHRSGWDVGKSEYFPPAAFDGWSTTQGGGIELGDFTLKSLDADLLNKDDPPLSQREQDYLDAQKKKAEPPLVVEHEPFELKVSPVNHQLGVLAGRD